MNMQTPIFIQNKEALDKALKEIQDAEHIFLDTEFIREKTYYPILSTIQFYAETENVFVIDMLADDLDVSEFITFLKNPKLIKVFHSGRQDIEIFHHQFGIIPLPLMDTQIAACYLGYGEQVSFDSIVKNKTDIILDKTYQRTNWLNRPLSAEQLNYAALDVYALSFIYHALQNELVKKNRETWCNEELSILTNPDTYKIQPEMLLKRIKHRLNDGASVDILQQLLIMREEIAIEQNLIRNAICYDDNLVELAEKKPRTFDAIRKIVKKSHERFLEHIPHILEMIEKSLLNKDALQERYQKNRSVPCLNSIQEKISSLLALYIKQIADENHLSPRLIASQADINNYLINNTAPFLTGWRYELCGEVLGQISNGEKALYFDGKNIKLMDK